MRSLTRRGFSLVELLVSLLLLTMLAMAAVVLIRGVGRVATRATASLLVDRTVQSLQLILEQELRDGSSSDVAVLAPSRLALSRPIGEATPCGDNGSIVLIADTAWSGTRLPEGARDDAWLLLDPVAATWLRMPIDSVDTGICPDGSSAMRLHLGLHAGSAALLRALEPVELSAYRSGVSDWYGLTPANHSSVVQPFAGPLVPGAARFTWFADRLEVVVPALGAAAITFSPPLRLVP